MSSPTQRSLKEMRDRGYICQVVERWNAYAKIRQDLYNFGDVIAIRPGEIVLVQATTTGNITKRHAKILLEPKAAVWKQAGGRILVHGWAKRGARGERKIWTLKEIIL